MSVAIPPFRHTPSLCEQTTLPTEPVYLSRIRAGLLSNTGSISLQRQEIFCLSEMFRPPLRLAELLSMGPVTSLSRNKATVV